MKLGVRVGSRGQSRLVASEPDVINFVKTNFTARLQTNNNWDLYTIRQQVSLINQSSAFIPPLDYN